LLRVVGRGIPETRADVGEIGPRDDHGPIDTALDDGAHGAQEPLRTGIVLRAMTGSLAFTDAAQDGNDAHRTLPDEVLDEHGLKLERVLALVIEDIREGIERRARGDGVDGGVVHGHAAQWSLEGLAAECERFAHRGMRGAEKDECIDLLGQTGSQEPVGVAVPSLAAPGVDVRRDQAAHTPASFLRPSAADAIVGQISAELLGIGMVRAAGVRRFPDR
jgi:hypothetical protein